MANFSHLAVQSAIYELLAGDLILAGLITGVYDRPPQATQFPYITLGDFSVTDWSSKTTQGCEHKFVIHVWSRQGGRKESAQLMERIHTLLHEQNLTVEGHTLILMRFLASAITLENDGWTYHGQMQFHALLEADAT